MTTRTPNIPKTPRRWLKVVTLVFGVLMGLTVAMASASALQPESQEHSCCCGDAADEASSDEVSSHDGCAHQEAQPSTTCDMASPSGSCACHIKSGDNTPVGEPIALGAGSFSFAPAAAASLHPQLDIPLARAPSAPSSDWLYGHSPPEPLYILHSTFLI